MFKTIETQLLKTPMPPELVDEFFQHDFERMRRFCVLVLSASLFIWLMFDLIVSFQAGQGLTWRSLVFMLPLAALVLAVAYVRRVRHFEWLNLAFVLVIATATRLVINGLPNDLEVGWLVVAAATILFTATVMPQRRWGFYATLAITWIVLNPFVSDLQPFDLKGSLVVCYALFLSALTTYAYFSLRLIKLHNFYMSRQLLDQAYFDTLTEIPNRRSFLTLAGKRLPAAARDGDHYLAMIDIDNFKKVNDTHGHDIGDVVLKRIAADIKACMGEFVYARLGGEEFALYIWGLGRDEVARRVDALCATVRTAPVRYPVTISIGVAHIDPRDSMTMALVKADQALYAAKHNGKDRYTFNDR